MPNYKDTNIPVYPSLALFDQILSGVISLELTTLGIVTRKAAAARPLVRAPYTVVLYYPPPLNRCPFARVDNTTQDLVKVSP
jgi:hypothetical protein